CVGGPVGFFGVDERDAVFEVEGVDDVRAALVEVEGAGVYVYVCRGAVDDAEQPSGGLFDDGYLRVAGAAEVHVGAPFAGPVPAGGAWPQHAGGDELVEGGAGGRPEQGQVRFG